jgi:hypothetical protein
MTVNIYLKKQNSSECGGACYNNDLWAVTSMLNREGEPLFMTRSHHEPDMYQAMFLTRLTNKQANVTLARPSL